MGIILNGVSGELGDRDRAFLTSLASAFAEAYVQQDDGDYFYVVL
ncbi:hypothetical protein [Microcoleus sp. FACHB-831]|jgi:hypothetical protein|nr:hypothetical protein [Microcoleus sp. FACHB-831]